MKPFSVSVRLLDPIRDGLMSFKRSRLLNYFKQLSILRFEKISTQTWDDPMSKSCEYTRQNLLVFVVIWEIHGILGNQWNSHIYLQDSTAVAVENWQICAFLKHLRFPKPFHLDVVSYVDNICSWKGRNRIHMLHVWYIYLHIYQKLKPNVGKYPIHGAYGI